MEKTQQKSRCRLCDGWNEMINHIITGFSKLAHNEYETYNDWVGYIIHWEMYKKFKFDYMNKWYMHNPESVQENEMHKLP